MSGEKNTTYAQGLLEAIFTAVFNSPGVSTLLSNAGTSPNTFLYVSLHTADPGAGGTQSTSEVTYTGYARVAVARSASGWNATTTPGTVTPVAAIGFPPGTGGGGTAGYFGIGTAATGTGQLLYSGPITPPITLGNGVTPTLTTATAISEA